MDKRKIILDCDPGHDDAVAIMLAAKSPQIDLLGITVVAGNQTLEKTTANALNVCQYLGLDIPVYAGCGQPMIRDKQVIADDIHGETGLDGPVFAPLRKKAEDKHAVLYIIDTLMASDGDITLVPTGPLTNIAMAIRMEPRILPKIREIVLMLLHIVGRTATEVFSILCLIYLCQCTFDKCRSTSDYSHHPHPEDRSRSACRDSSRDSCDISCSDTGCCGNHKRLKR